MSKPTKTLAPGVTPAPVTEGAPDETSLAAIGTDGILAPSDVAKLLAESGFCQNRTIKIGDPDKGGILAYSGELIGPGPDIELNAAAAGRKDDDGPATLPTWQCHPFSIKTMQPVTNVIDTVICTRGLDDIFKKAAALAASKGGSAKVQVAVQWTGRGENRLGQPLNHYVHALRVVNSPV